MTTFLSYYMGSHAVVVEAYRLGKYDNILTLDGTPIFMVVEAYRLGKYDNNLFLFW